MNVIAFRDVCYELSGHTILANFNAHIAAGSFTVLVGESGSGKSTLLDLCAGVQKPTSGEIHYPLWKMPVKEQIAYLPQANPIPPYLTTFNYVASALLNQRSFLRRLFTKLSFSDHMYVMDYLDKVNLMHLKDRNVTKLSGGEKRRIEIAATFIQDKEVYIFDEPISGLDPQTASQIMDEIAQLQRENGKTVLCAISQFELAQRYATDIFTYQNGVWKSYFPGERKN